MKLRTVLLIIGAFLLSLLPWILEVIKMLFKNEVSKAETIVSAADQQKEAIHQEIKSDSDQALADLFNKSIKKEENK